MFYIHQSKRSFTPSSTANLQDYVNDNYKDSRNYDLLAFWNDVCRDSCIRDLLMSPPGEGTMSAFFSLPSRSKDNPAKAGSLRTSADRLEHVRRQAIEEMSRRHDNEDELFVVGRLSGTQELAGQRVLQIATIVRNLSFEEDNTSILAKNLTCLR
jgi:hypothetical protein